jgi:hypothetical protein
MTNLTYEEFGFGSRTSKLSNLNPGILRESIMNYVDSLPAKERKELKEDLTYDKQLYEEFSSKMYSFFSLYFIETEKDFENKSKPLIQNMITNNKHILCMYNYHLKNRMKIHGLFIDLEKVIPKVKLILDKGFLEFELSNQLPVNETNPIKKLKV